MQENLSSKHFKKLKMGCYDIQKKILPVSTRFEPDATSFLGNYADLRAAVFSESICLYASQKYLLNVSQNQAWGYGETPLPPTPRRISDLPFASSW